MNTQHELIEADTESVNHAAEVEALRRQLAELQAGRPGMDATLAEIEQRAERTRALNAAPSADAFVKRKATTLEGIEADALAEQADVSAEVCALAQRGHAIKLEQAEVESALFAAEGRMKVLSSPSRAGYVTARAELAGRALMGESVDLSAVPAEDTAGTLSVSDVQAGIQALKQRRDSLTAEYNRVRIDYRPLVLNYCRLHGVVSACRFIKAKRQMTEATLGLLAAHSKSLEMVGSGSVASASLSFMPLHFEHDFKVPAMNQIPQLKEVNGFDASVISCELLHQSGKVSHAVSELSKAMMGGAA